MKSARATAGFTLLLPIAAAAVVAGCEDGVPVVRGFDSRQLLAMRDPTLRFNPNGGYGSFTTHVIYTTGDEAAGETAVTGRWTCRQESSGSTTRC